MGRGTHEWEANEWFTEGDDRCNSILVLLSLEANTWDLFIVKNTIIPFPCSGMGSLYTMRVETMLICSGQIGRWHKTSPMAHGMQEFDEKRWAVDRNSRMTFLQDFGTWVVFLCMSRQWHVKQLLALLRPVHGTESVCRCTTCLMDELAWQWVSSKTPRLRSLKSFPIIPLAPSIVTSHSYF